MSAPSPLIGALAQLKDAEAALTRDLGATREAIAAIEGVLKLPPSTARVTGPKHPGALPPATRNGRSPRALPQTDEADVAAAVSALKGGPLKVAAFLTKTKLSKWQARALVRRGVIVATGSTQARRLSLPGAAKEEP